MKEALTNITLMQIVFIKVTTKFLTEEGGYNANAPIPVGKALKETFPEIEEVTTTMYEGDR
jgi:hypothetical protein